MIGVSQAGGDHDVQRAGLALATETPHSVSRGEASNGEWHRDETPVEDLQKTKLRQV